LAEIDQEISPDLEVAAITRRAYETCGKAPLFNNVTGAKDGLFRVLGAPGGLRKSEKGTYGRLARHLALPVEASMKDIIDKMLSAKGADPIPPVVVDKGPCQENMIFGDDIDLDNLPTPKGMRLIQYYKEAKGKSLTILHIRTQCGWRKVHSNIRHAYCQIPRRQMDKLVNCESHDIR
jgi:UbiD family decarboxylase